MDQIKTMGKIINKPGEQKLKSGKPEKKGGENQRPGPFDISPLILLYISLMLVSATLVY